MIDDIIAAIEQSKKRTKELKKMLVNDAWVYTFGEANLVKKIEISERTTKRLKAYAKKKAISLIEQL